jgi:hypothetical protein
VLDLLTDQHTEVDELIAKLEDGKGDGKALFQELADKLAAHATVEEKIFYPGVMMEKTKDMLMEAVEEHLEVKRLLADMMMLEPDSEQFTAKLAVLKENLEHHAHEEEEDKLFPTLRKQMDEEQLAALGNEVLAMFEQLMTAHPSANIPNETARAARLPQP